MAEQRKQYYKDNKEHIIEQIKEYQKNNKDHKNQYYEDNKEKILEQIKQYQKNNKTKISEQKKQYYIKKKLINITI